MGSREPGTGRPLVLHIGMNRSGSTSLAAALRILGFRVGRHEVDGTRISDIAESNRAAGRPPLAELDERFDAFVNFAPYRWFEELDDHYPGSRFILTDRRLTDWLASRERKVRLNQENPDYDRDFNVVDHEAWTALRADVYARVEHRFAGREDDLLVMNIPAGDGWENLCGFLDCPVPEIPFPHENKGKGLGHRT
ncbi:MAG: sulfotransferase [Pseudomonadota bacterium]